jgi:hypothetical protein
LTVPVILLINEQTVEACDSESALKPYSGQAQRKPNSSNVAGFKNIIHP